MERKANVIVSGKARTVAVGTALSDLLDLPLPCGGHGKCGKCKVYAAGALSPVTDTERKCLTAEELQRGIRLACRTAVTGDCSVDLPETQKLGQQIMMQTSTITAPAPAFGQYGIALDIGTTTLAAQLYNKAGAKLAECGRRNPQATWGADVISRIESALHGDLDQLSNAIREAIDGMIRELAKQARINAKEIDGMVITGNTAMLYLLTGSSPGTLSRAPFQADRLFGETLTAKDLHLSALFPQAEIYLPPCIAAFVGADTVCAILATNLCEIENALLADIGTNGEMGLWHSGTLSVCSTAAGPAFEGVGISMGMNGEAGAIDHVTLRNGQLTAHTIGETAPRGICGSGLIDAVACLLENETLDETGLLDDDPTEIAKPVVLIQKDIRMVQLAKSAICAGIRMLFRTAGLSEDQISAFYIAGGFGSYLNVGSAGRIGLIPDALTAKAKAVGNAALTGAAMLLLNGNLRQTAANLAKKANVVELSTNPAFADAYMMGMTF